MGAEGGGEGVVALQDRSEMVQLLKGSRGRLTTGVSTQPQARNIGAAK